MSLNTVSLILDMVWPGDDRREDARKPTTKRNPMSRPVIETGNPLRDSVARLTLFRCAWTAVEVAEAAGTATPTAASYCATLVAGGVLVREGDGFRAGPAAMAWRKEAKPSKGGGNSEQYRRRKRIMDQMAVRDWQNKAPDTVVLTVQKEAGRSITAQETAMPDCTPLDEAARRLAVDRSTVRRWAKTGRLCLVKIGPRCARIRTDSLERLIRGNA